MGTASTMNSLAEALGMSLTGCAAIPAPYKERPAMAYLTGKRIVEMVHEDLTPSKIMTREAFENVIATCAAIGGSTNAPWHIIAIARHMGVELTMKDWQEVGHHIPLLVNMQPVGEYLGEGYYRGGGVPAVMKELLGAGEIREGAMTVTGRTMGENLKAWNGWVNRDVIKPYDQPMAKNAGFLVMNGNLFESAIMKTSAISTEFRERYLQRAGDEDAFEGRAIVFEGPEDYHKRINDASLAIDADCILFIRGCGPVGYPGSAEVVNMAAPAYLLKQGIHTLPCIGDGRQSGTSGSPSILNASPESAVGGGLALLKTGDKVRVDLKKRRVDMVIPDAELAARRKAWQPPKLVSQTPWQEIYRAGVGQLQTGACLEAATRFQDVVHTYGEPRHSH
jgi:dihydroxy-acid dehydratase